MKNLLAIILSIASIVIIFTNQCKAVSIADFTPTLDKKIAKMETVQEKVEYLQYFTKLLSTTKYTKNNNARLYKEIKEYCLNMLNVFEYELREEQENNIIKNGIVSINSNDTAQTNQKINSSVRLSDNLPNIDVQKIRDALLSWHNEEKASLWRNPYRYNLNLEWSATIRANNLSVSGKTKNLHARNAWDWYYNYTSMTNRFSSIWINFWKAPKWAASFSETIWRNVYKCNKSDCTQDLITAVKKTRDWLIMKEKASNGSHYRAATMKHFTQMWAWIAIDKNNNRYYLVIHYGVDTN